MAYGDQIYKTSNCYRCFIIITPCLFILAIPVCRIVETIISYQNYSINNIITILSIINSILYPFAFFLLCFKEICSESIGKFCCIFIAIIICYSLDILIYIFSFREGGGNNSILAMLVISEISYLFFWVCAVCIIDFKKDKD